MEIQDVIFPVFSPSQVKFVQKCATMCELLAGFGERILQCYWRLCNLHHFGIRAHPFYIMCQIRPSVT